jgi:two-component system, OmpR family, alkaline phosphatase synthesis response regulator PhoP
MNENILLIEDEDALRTTLRDRLRGEGFVVDTAKDGEEGLDKINSLPFDLLILDVMLPYRNGFDLCRDIRQAGLATPILFLTARNETLDKVVGLKLGGDDYVTKPFESAELIARIEALLRRAPVQTGRGVHQIGALRVDVARREVTREGKPIYLSGREFQLLRYMMERSGQTISRTELLRTVWGYDVSAYTRTVDVHVFSLRKKLEEEPNRPQLIITVPGVGYKFEGSKNPRVPAEVT